MKPILTALTALVFAAGAHAGEVFKSTDSQGRPVYTDKPATLPAQKLDVRTSETDVVEVQKRYDEEMKRYAANDKAASEAVTKAADQKKATELTAADRAKRCEDARQNYESVMRARRLYEPGATEGERRYLSDAEIDQARANAKKTMDSFCSGI